MMLTRSPEPPKRIEEEVALFRVYYPDATVEDWEAFAVRLACNAHRSGFARGFHWATKGWKLDDRNQKRIDEQAVAAESLGDAHPFAARLLRARGDEQDPLFGVSSPDRAAFFALLEANPFYVAQPVLENSDDE